MAEGGRTSFPIKTWIEKDRPRERLLQNGKEALSDAELLAVLIGSGSRKESAVDLCRRILSEQRSLNQLGKLSVEQLRRYNGIGEAKAISIVAAMELGRRRRCEDSPEREKITSSSSVFEIMQPRVGELPHEEFWILYLNNSNKVIKLHSLSKGGITGTLVDIRLAMKEAIYVGATSIILVHNHPSGDPAPSVADVRMTKEIIAAAKPLGIMVHDHIIIGRKGHASLKALRLI